MEPVMEQDLSLIHIQMCIRDSIWRAPTDNDMYIKSEWKKAHYDKAYTRAYTTEEMCIRDRNKDELRLVHFPNIKITFEDLFDEIDY